MSDQVFFWNFCVFSFSSGYDPRRMVEMDRFVTSLKGNTIETIERKSTESAATMKDHLTTFDKYVALSKIFKVII